MVGIDTVPAVSSTPYGMRLPAEFETEFENAAREKQALAYLGELCLFLLVVGRCFVS